MHETSGSGVYIPPRKTSLHVNMAPPSSPPVISRPLSRNLTSSQSHASEHDARNAKLSRFIVSHTPSTSRHSSNAVNERINPNVFKKRIAEMNDQIEGLDEKSDKQNLFFLNEMMENFRIYDSRNQDFVRSVENKIMLNVNDVEERVNSVQYKMELMEGEVKRSLQDKFHHIDSSMKLLKKQIQQYCDHNEVGQKRNSPRPSTTSSVTGTTKRPVIDRTNSSFREKIEFRRLESQQRVQELGIDNLNDTAFENDETRKLRNHYEAERAKIIEEFAKKEESWKQQLEEQKQKTIDKYRRQQSGTLDDKIKSIEEKFNTQLAEEDKKNSARLDNLLDKFDKFIERQESGRASTAPANLSQSRNVDNAQDNPFNNGTIDDVDHTAEEKNALLKIFRKTGGVSAWKDTYLWSKSNDMTSWLGVDLNHGRVTGLLLGNNGLVGEIPHDLVELHNLSDLQLFGNGLSGVIPTFVGQLTNLQTLLLNENDLTGNIPSSISNCVLLEELDLRYAAIE